MTTNDDKNEPGVDAGAIGRGAFYLTLTKLWFMVSGYVIYFGLPRLLGAGEEGKALFGKYQVAISLASIANALAVQGTTQAVSRFVGSGNAAGVRQAALRLQGMLGGGAFLLLFLGAPSLADFYEDATLTQPFRCAAFITLFYSFYGIYMGWLNGSRQFARQALVDFSFSTLKVAGTLGGAYALKTVVDPVSGPIVGWAAAALAVLVMGRILSGPAQPGSTVTVRQLFNFQLFTMFVAGAATGIAKADLQVVKIGLSRFTEMSLQQIDAAVAEYTAGQVFATIPYQAVFAITFILFPLVSQASGRDDAKMRGYVKQTTRYAAMIAGAACSLFMACPERSITILYTADYAEGAPVLRYLAAGYFFYSIFFILVSIITASGRPAQSFRLVFTTLVLQLVLGFPLVMWMGTVGAALGTMLAMLVALVMAHAFVCKTFGQGLDFGMLARVLAGGLGVGLIAHLFLAKSAFWGGSGFLAQIGGTGLVAKLVTVGGFGVCGVLYLIVLAVLGVFDAEDRARFGKILKRG